MTSLADPYMTRVQVRGQGAAEDLSGDVRLGRTAGVGKQGGVVGLRSRLPVDAQPVGEAHCDQGPVQAVLEWKGHTEIGRQAQRRDYLGCPDTVVALRHDCHAAHYRPPDRSGDLHSHYSSSNLNT